MSRKTSRKLKTLYKFFKGYSKEEVDSELEKLTGTRPLFYLKFCSEEKFATDNCEGKLYANTPKYFREKEIESGERGQGDQFELMSIIEAQSIIMFQ